MQVLSLTGQPVLFRVKFLFRIAAFSGFPQPQEWVPSHYRMGSKQHEASSVPLLEGLLTFHTQMWNLHLSYDGNLCNRRVLSPQCFLSTDFQIGSPLLCAHKLTALPEWGRRKAWVPAHDTIGWCVLFFIHTDLILWLLNTYGHFLKSSRNVFKLLLNTCGS